MKLLYLICSQDDGISNLGVQAVVLVHLCCGSLQDPKGLDDLDLRGTAGSAQTINHGGKTYFEAPI